MNYRASIYTLALLGALALAALSARPPSRPWTTTWSTRPIPGSTAVPARETVPENTPPGVNIGNPISATDDDDDGENNNDIEFGNTLTYSLERHGRGVVRHRPFDRTAHHQGPAGHRDESELRGDGYGQGQ